MTMTDCIIPNRKTDLAGYVMMRFEGRYQGMHRVAWQILNGPVPKGLVIDHTCHNEDTTCSGGTNCQHRACVNPAHLRAVSHLENVQAGQRVMANRESCVNGHAVSENLAHRPNGRAYCLSCRKESNKASMIRLKERA